MFKISKNVMLCMFMLSIVACGSDSDNVVDSSVKSDNLNNGAEISCYNRDNGFFYWRTSESQCSINCHEGRIKYIQCYGR